VNMCACVCACACASAWLLLLLLLLLLLCVWLTTAYKLSPAHFLLPFLLFDVFERDPSGTSSRNRGEQASR
jgi:hypothetical protein